MLGRLKSKLSCHIVATLIVTGLATTNAVAQSNAKTFIDTIRTSAQKERLCEAQSLARKQQIAFGNTASTIGTVADGPVVYPDLRYAWDSNFGKIFWLGGTYGHSEEKTIRGALTPATSIADSSAVFEGEWGSRDPESGEVSWRGRVKFIFNGGFTFRGSYQGVDGKWKPWNGSFSSVIGSGQFSYPGYRDEPQILQLKTQLNALEAKFRQVAGVCVDD